MNGPTNIPTTHPSTDLQPPILAKTDTPLPLGDAVVEISESQAATPSERIISGIDLVDFGAGGLMPGHLYLIKGGSGLGKSIMGLQFLTRGLELGEPAILITDQKPESVLAQAKSVGFPIADAVKRQQFTILNPSERYFDLVESPADVVAIVEELADYIRTIGAKRLVIDPVFTLVNTSYSAHFAIALTQSLLNALEDLPTTTLLIGTDDERAEMTPIMRAIESNSFGVVGLSNDAVSGGRTMRLSKLRYANCENLQARYRILDGRGVTNYSGDEDAVVDVTKPWAATEAASRSVLLIGAQPDTIRRVTEALGPDYSITAESDLRKGVERAKEEHPGLVLVTPSRSVGAVAAVLELAQQSRSSVAFLSPNGNRQSDRVLYLRAGADDFIAEPFNPFELRARVDALVRRTGRRLTVRDSRIASITPEEITALMQRPQTETKSRAVMSTSGAQLSFNPEFRERLQRSIDTVSKFETPFALYWMKSETNDRELSRAMANLCRQEDILCHNSNGEFVAILTGTDQNGLRGFEQRIEEKLGDKLGPRVKRGHQLHQPGEPTTGFPERALELR